MNIFEADVLNKILDDGYTNQREIVGSLGFSLGVVNACLSKLQEGGYLDGDLRPGEMAFDLAVASKPKNAVILAAGPGLRMIPINNEVPKALLEIKGEILIERLIRQLLDAGIEEIDIVVGFLKEKFEYLCDKFGVNLVYNPEYARKNNIHSLRCVAEKIENTYIMPADIWLTQNPFNRREFYSWYLVTDSPDSQSTVRINRQRELVPKKGTKQGNKMIGISYLNGKDGPELAERVICFCKNPAFDNAFWEDALFVKEARIYARVFRDETAAEIDSYEQLRELDRKSHSLDSKVLTQVAKNLGLREKDIQNIAVLKKGMTNRSFLFEAGDTKYICRIPGEGTDNLINREQEYAVYEAIKSLSISDEVICMSPQSGLKVTKYLHNARVCDPFNPGEVRACMAFLKRFHEQKLRVPHAFDIFERTLYYESLWEGHESIFKDHEATKEKIGKLQELLKQLPAEYALTHIDAVPDNFLFTDQGMRLIDWEYAGMADPHTDIAMFAIYSMYDRDKTEELIDFYFESNCPPEIRLKIYCYIAACGLLWSNWCEYKRFCGVEFGQYSLRQYRYAKEYYKIAERFQQSI